MRADPHSSSTFLPTPLGFCRTPAAVEVLVRYQADVNFPGGKYALQYFPLQVAIGEQAPLPVIAKLLELRANVNGGEAGTGGAGNVSPLGLLSFGFEENPDLIETAQLLLDKRANVNQVAQLQGLPRIMELTSRAVASYRRNSSEFVKCTSAWGSSPLGYCVVMECEELLAFLLHARADPRLPKSRGRSALDFAAQARRKVQRILSETGSSMPELESAEDELVPV